MGGRVLALLGLFVVVVAATPGCTGGCYVKADTVRTEPQTDCLQLYAGQSASDPTVCAVPQLGGVNNCSEALTLPSGTSTGDPVVVAPGAKIVYPIAYQSVPPSIIVTERGSSATDYVIIASVGDQAVTITVPVHDD